MPRPSRLSQRATAGAGSEPAALMHRPSTAKRKRKDVQRFTYRIDPALNNAALAAVEEYADAGHTVTVSQVVNAWLEAGYQLWLDGQVEVQVQVQRTARLSRSLQRVACDTEAPPHQAGSDDASGAQATREGRDPVGWLQSGCGEET